MVFCQYETIFHYCYHSLHVFCCVFVDMASDIEMESGKMERWKDAEWRIDVSQMIRTQQRAQWQYNSQWIRAYLDLVQITSPDIEIKPELSLFAA